MEDHKIKIIRQALKDNQDAIQLVEDLAYIARTWDDIVDNDRPVSNEQKNKMLWKIMVGIQSNPFYDKYRQHFVACFKDYLNSWMDANDLEKGDDHSRHIAFILRDLVGNIVMHCAEIIGGYDWMRTISPCVRSFQFDESFEDYKESLNNGTV